MPESPEHTPTELVYVLGTPGSNIVKIGRTTNLAKRVADIQRMSPVPLVVLWSCPGGHELETNLHRHFKTVRSHGEWFAFAEDPVSLVRQAVESRPWLRPRPPRQVKRVARPTIIDLRATPDPTLLVQPGSKIATARDRVMAELAAIPDPVDQFHALNRIHARLTEDLAGIKQSAVLGLKVGRTWRSVGELIGTSGARAEQISRRAR